VIPKAYLSLSIRGTAGNKLLYGELITQIRGVAAAKKGKAFEIQHESAL
jgi:hypothetical protein